MIRWDDRRLPERTTIYLGDTPEEKVDILFERLKEVTEAERGKHYRVKEDYPEDGPLSVEEEPMMGIYSDLLDREAYQHGIDTNICYARDERRSSGIDGRLSGAKLKLKSIL